MKKLRGHLAVPLLLLGSSFAFSLIACRTGVRELDGSEEEEVLVGADRILSMDYDREADVLYVMRGSARANVLSRHDLTSGEEEILSHQIPDAVGWVSISRRGTIFVLDWGDNPYETSLWGTTKPPKILELREAAPPNILPILTPTMLFEKSGREEKTRETIAAGCAVFIEESTRQVPLGIERVDRVLEPALTPEMVQKRDALLEKIHVVHLPRFLVLSPRSGPDVVVTLEDCGLEMFQQFHDRLLSDNLSSLNETVVSATEEDSKALEDGKTFAIDKSMDFALRSISKGFGYYELPCEKYYDEVAWGSVKIGMGFCVHGILGFPQSFDLFTGEGEFIYHRRLGVYKVRRPS